MTFFNRKSQRTFTCQIVQNTKRHLKRAKTMQISGIGHSVIRGLVTTGQWFSASTTVYPRGSPQGRRHSYFVDCWTFINRLAPSRCRLAAQMHMDSLNKIHCVKIKWINYGDTLYIRYNMQRIIKWAIASNGNENLLGAIFIPKNKEETTWKRK